jgi:hypothetical protein
VFVQAGAQAPECVEFTIANPALASQPLDLTSVTAAMVRVLRPDGQHTTWAVDITAQSADALTLRHTFSLDDVYKAGCYQISVEMAVPAGVRRAGPTVIEVRS